MYTQKVTARKILIYALLILCSGWTKELSCLTVGAGFEHKLARLTALIPWRWLTTCLVWVDGVYAGYNKLVNGFYQPKNRTDGLRQPTMIWYRGLHKNNPEMGFSINMGFFYNGTSYQNEWFGGTLISGNLQTSHDNCLFPLLPPSSLSWCLCWPWWALTIHGAGQGTPWEHHQEAAWSCPANQPTTFTMYESNLILHIDIS